MFSRTFKSVPVVAHSSSVWHHLCDILTMHGISPLSPAVDEYLRLMWLDVSTPGDTVAVTRYTFVLLVSSTWTWLP